MLETGSVTNYSIDCSSIFSINFQVFSSLIELISSSSSKEFIFRYPCDELDEINSIKPENTGKFIEYMEEPSMELVVPEPVSSP